MNDDRLPSPRPPCRSLPGVRVLGTGSYVPDAVVTNDHLHQRFGFDSDWIVKRTGILERRHALPHQATSDLCLEAARRCIEQARVKPADIDLFSHVATWNSPPSHPHTATVLLRPGRAFGIRRFAAEVRPGPDGDEVEIGYNDADGMARWLVGYGSDVVVLGPEDVRKATIARLRDLAEQLADAAATVGAPG